jgi:thioesterase domain-containing protein
MERLFGKDLKISYDALRSLGPDEQLSHLTDRLLMAKALPSGAGTNQVRGLVQVVKANSQVRYFPQEVLPTQITLILTSEDDHEAVIGNEQPSEIPRREGAWGWDKFSEKPIEIYNVPGNHLTMMTEPHVQVLAERLKSCLNWILDVG